MVSQSTAINQFCKSASSASLGVKVGPIPSSSANQLAVIQEDEMVQYARGI
jgi:hypothetical protein